MRRLFRPVRRLGVAVWFALLATVIALVAVAAVIITIQGQRRDGYVRSCESRNEQNSAIVQFITSLPYDHTDPIRRRQRAIFLTLTERAFPVIEDCQKYAKERT